MLRNTRHRACIRTLLGLLGLARYCLDSVLGGLEHCLGGVLDWPMYLKIAGIPMYLKIAGIGVQNEAWRDRKSMKMVAWRVGNRGKWWLRWSDIEENCVLAGSWTVLGRLLGFMMRFSRNFCRSWGEDGRKMGEVGGKLRPRWAMIAPSWAKMAPRLGRFW